MKVTQTELPGVLVIEPKVFGDARGYFLETWNQAGYAEAGIPGDFVQDNLSLSGKGILRGLHFQHPCAQSKLVYVPAGEVYDVAVDIRLGSSSFGRWVGVTLSAENKRQLFIPEGFAHGFCVTSESALFVYKCTNLYNLGTEGCVLWNDPDIGIKWPITEPRLSDKDQRGVRLKDMPRERLPTYRG